MAGKEIARVIYNKKSRFSAGLCTTYGIRTRDSSVKGRRLNPLTNAAFIFGTAKIGLGRFPAKLFYKNENYLMVFILLHVVVAVQVSST